MYIRSVKIPSSNGSINEYVRVVESYRDQGKVKQRVIADLGRKDLLVAILPQLQRFLTGEPAVPTEDSALAEVLDASTWGPVLVVRHLFEQLGLWNILDRHLKPARTDVSFTDRVFALVANRLIAPSSEHALAHWLDTDYVCDRRGRRFVPHWHTRGRVKVHLRQLDAWYRTLDTLIQAKDKIEVDLFKQLRDLFSLRPDLVLYDITSTYFEGAGPKHFAKHGHSRDGKSQNVQVVIGMVMVNGWPITHHVWEGNKLDFETVSEILADLQTRFEFERVVFVGDRGMVTEANLEALTKKGHGYLVGIKRRRNAELNGWLEQIDESAWVDCPMGITARERKKNPPRTRVQEIKMTHGCQSDEVTHGCQPGEVTHGCQPDEVTQSCQRVFVIDSDERREFESKKREQSMERTRVKLEKLQQRVAKGRLVQPERIGAAAARALQAHHGHRYFAWELRDGVFRFFEHPVNFAREKRLEGRYVIATSEPNMTALDAVALYKELTDVERGFRRMKDVLELRPVYHQVEPRVKAHVFIAALALLLETYLDKSLRKAGVDMTAEVAMKALQTIRYVTFKVDGESRSGVSANNPRARQILKALGITNLRPPTPPEGEQTIL